MTICARCHRPLRNEPAVIGGVAYGPVCAKSVDPVPVVERDLFGFDVPAAAAAAVERVRVHVEALAADARIAVRNGFAAARRRAGVWAQ